MEDYSSNDPDLAHMPFALACNKVDLVVEDDGESYYLFPMMFV